MGNPMKKGYVMLARQIVESEIFGRPATWLKIFIFLLIQAQHEPYKKLKRGQCYTTYLTISEACGVNRNEIDHAIRFMKKEQMLATQKATRGMIVTICNYDTYQDIEYYKSDGKSDTEATHTMVCGDTEATQKRQDKGRMEEWKNDNKNDKRKNKRFVPPTQEEVSKYITDNPELSNVDPINFWKSFNDGGWIDTRGNPVRNWKLKIRTWSSYGNDRRKTQGSHGKGAGTSFAEQESKYGETL